MEEKKGIFYKLLAVVGVVLVAVGVFVFQNVSRAEDEGGTPAVGNNVVVPDNEDEGDEVTTDTNVTNNTEGGEDIQNNEDEGGAPVAQTYDYAINYYTKDDETENLFTSQTYTGVETEYIFDIVADAPVDAAKGDFIGWLDEDGKIYHAGDKITLNSEKSELKLIAKFAFLKKYTMIYYANGGVGAPSSQTGESYADDYDFTLSAAVPVRDGFEFKGWQKEGNDTTVYAPGATVKSRSATEPMIMKAVWAEIRTFTLIYEGNGGAGVPAVQTCKSANGSCNFVVSTAAPTKNGNNFAGWLIGDNAVAPGAEITATESITMLVASWSPIYNFKLVYEAKDANDVPDAQSCETAMGTCTFIVPDKEPTKDGYKFLGWRFEDKQDMLAKAGDELVVTVDGPLELKVIAVWSRIYAVLNSGEVFGAGERVVIRSVADFGGFKELKIDEMVIPEEYYSVTEGATSVILSNAYAQSLSTGEHAFVVTWEDGEASGIISVNQSEDGSKRFVVVDATGTTDGMGLMYRPKAGAVSKESTGVLDAATGNEESNFDAVRTLVIVAVAAFVVVYIVNRFYVHHKMGFIEEL